MQNALSLFESRVFGQVFTLFFLTLACVLITGWAVRKVRERNGGRVQQDRVSIRALIVGGALLAPVWAFSFGLVLIMLWKLAWSFDPHRIEPTDLRWYALAIVGLFTAIAGLIGAPLAMIRIQATERQTNAQEQGLVTERITRAVEGLGSEKTTSNIGRVYHLSLPVEEDFFVPKGEKFEVPEDPHPAEILRVENWEQQDDNHQDVPGQRYVVKRWLRPDTYVEWEGQAPQLPAEARIDEPGKWQAISRTEPNMEVRIGAIFALERIAQDSDRDHVQIMEILCAYIRENSPAADAADPPDGLRPGQLIMWIGEQPRLRHDIQTALMVLGRRSDHQRRIEDQTQDRRGKAFRLDLSGSNLQRADFSGLNFDRALFRRCRLEGCYANGAFFRSANFRKANLRPLFFETADFSGAYFRQTQFETARIFRQAEVDGALFRQMDLSQMPLEACSKVMVDFKSNTVCPSLPAHWPTYDCSWRTLQRNWQSWAVDRSHVFAGSKATEDAGDPDDDEDG